jgi:hypothetical protein
MKGEILKSSLIGKFVSAPPETRCLHTGLGVPECSCPNCVEDQLRRYRPDLSAGARAA